MGCWVSEIFSRDVRLRYLGSEAKKAFSGPRQTGQEALGLLDGKRSLSICLRDKGYSSSGRGRTKGEPRWDSPLFDLSICSVSSYDLRRDKEITSRPLPTL